MKWQKIYWFFLPAPSPATLPSPPFDTLPPFSATLTNEVISTGYQLPTAVCRLSFPQSCFSILVYPVFILRLISVILLLQSLLMSLLAMSCLESEGNHSRVLTLRIYWVKPLQTSPCHLCSAVFVFILQGLVSLLQTWILAWIRATALTCPCVIIFFFCIFKFFYSHKWNQF